MTGVIPAAIFANCATPAAAFTAYVTNEKGDSVTVIDTDKMETTKTFPVGKRPRGIVVSKDGAEIFVCLGDDDAVAVIDTKTAKRTAKIASPDPEQLAQSPDGTRLYVANEDDNRVTIIDAQTHKTTTQIPVGVEPEGVAVSPDGKTVVSTSETTNMAHFIDPDAKKTVANVLVAARPRYAQFTPDGRELWVSSEVGGVVSVIDPDKHAVTGKITFDVPGLVNEHVQPVGIRFTKDGKTAFVALGPANRVAVVDVQSKKVQKLLLVGQRVWQLALTPDDKYLLAVNGVSNDVSFIDVAALKVVKSVQVGQLPWGVAMARQ
ncbi:MAG: PQQ-dependent catabolism-associated beta-propeller protein [Hyphomicrobiales bacterium]|nr:PQQ-dependent catabolism-associated beta-propeller protein [Hyphomicrobiales bacterium]